MAGVGCGFALMSRPSKEEREREAVCSAFIAILGYLDKNCDGLVSLDDVTAYLTDCGVELSGQEVEQMETAYAASVASPRKSAVVFAAPFYPPKPPEQRPLPVAELV